MRVYMVNEGTLRKPQGPCYAFAIFLQLKEVHLFPVKSHHVTVNFEYFKVTRRNAKSVLSASLLRPLLDKGFVKNR